MGVLATPYLIGYYKGFYEKEIREGYYHPSDGGGYWTFEEYKDDPEFDMGYEDGKYDRSECSWPQIGDFFAWSVNGWPWGSSLEQTFVKGKFSLEWIDESGENVKYKEEGRGELIYYRLAKLS